MTRAELVEQLRGDVALTRHLNGDLSTRHTLAFADNAEWMLNYVERLERCLEAHHAIAATTEDVLSYHDPRRCPVCEVEP